MIDPNLQSKIEEYLSPYQLLSPIAIAQGLGIKIVFVTLSEKAFSGAIKKIGEEVVIFVNEGEDFKRQLFTIAHELGHFFLHNGVVDKGIVSYRETNWYQKYEGDPIAIQREIEANHFAAQILMPRDTFVKYFTANYYKGFQEVVREMAKIFGASENAIKARIGYLDLLKYQTIGN